MNVRQITKYYNKHSSILYIIWLRRENNKYYSNSHRKEINWMYFVINRRDQKQRTLCQIETSVNSSFNVIFSYQFVCYIYMLVRIEKTWRPFVNVFIIDMSIFNTNRLTRTVHFILFCCLFTLLLIFNENFLLNDSEDIGLVKFVFHSFVWNK